MLPEIECVKVMTEVLKSLEIGEFVIRLNHRQLLNGLFEACGVPQEKFKSICSAVDKLDKVTSCNARSMKFNVALALLKRYNVFVSIFSTAVLDRCA